MSETPGGPEYYDPPPDAAPPPVPEPPSIADAAAQFDSAQWNTAPASPNSKAGLAITALVLGVVGVVTGWIPVWGLIVGVAAILFGAIALVKKQSKGKAISGIVLGAVSALMSIVVGIFFYLGMSQFGDNGDNFFTYGPSGQATLGPESLDGGLSIAEQAFAPARWQDSTTWFVVVLHNPSDRTYDFAEVTVNALDASGAVIDTAPNYPSLPPGDSVVAGTFYELNGTEVASLEVVGPTVDLLQGGPAKTVEVADLAATNDDYFTTVTGTVSSPAALEYGVAVTVIARDQTGAISGYAPGFVDALSQGGSGTFEAVFLEVMPQGTTYEAYAEPY